jgi:hypothetical protein
MTVLDTFYLLFKTDAKGTQADVAALDKQISALAAKGKSRSEDEVKELKELRKQRSEALRDIKDQTDATDKLGNSFVKMVENGAQAATSFLALGAIKAGVLNATQLNSSLEIQGKLLGQNITQMRAYDAAFQAAGSPAGTFLSVYQAAFQQQAAAGLAIPDPKTFLDRIRAGAKQYPTQQGKEQYFQRLGLPFDTASKTALEGSDSEYADFVKRGFKDAPLNEDEAKKARDFEKEMASVQQELLTAYKALGNDILPYVTSGLKDFADFLHNLSGTPGGPEALAVTGTIASGWGIKKFATWLLGRGGAAAAGEAAGGVSGTAIAAIAATAGALVYGGSWIGAEAGRWISGKSSGAAGTPSNPNKQASIAFWESQGYNPDQAVAWAAQEQAESSFGLDPRMDLNGHFGIFQWSPKRRAKIIKDFGIDVATAGHADQLKAASLEAAQMGLGPLGLPTDRDGANTALTDKFEIPSNNPYGLMMEAQKRANIAATISSETLGNAASSPLNSSSTISNTTTGGDRNTSVKIDNVNVHTQSTDADGMASAASDALKGHIRYAMSDFDDGRLA